MDSIRVLDAGDRHERAALKGHTGPPWRASPSFAPMDRLALVSVSADGTGRLWTIPDPPRPGRGQARPEAGRAHSIVLRGTRARSAPWRSHPMAQVVITARR